MAVWKSFIAHGIARRMPKRWDNVVTRRIATVKARAKTATPAASSVLLPGCSIRMPSYAILRQSRCARELHQDTVAAHASLPNGVRRGPPEPSLEGRGVGYVMQSCQQQGRGIRPSSRVLRPARSGAPHAAPPRSRTTPHRHSQAPPPRPTQAGDAPRATPLRPWRRPSSRWAGLNHWTSAAAASPITAVVPSDPHFSRGQMQGPRRARRTRKPAERVTGLIRLAGRGRRQEHGDDGHEEEGDEYF